MDRSARRYRPPLEQIPARTGRGGIGLCSSSAGLVRASVVQEMELEINLQVFSAVCSELARCGLFRDWLCINVSDGELYASPKRELAARRWDRVHDHPVAKAAVISDNMSRTEAWNDISRRQCPSGASERRFSITSAIQSLRVLRLQLGDDVGR